MLVGSLLAVVAREAVPVPEPPFLRPFANPRLLSKNLCRIAGIISAIGSGLSSSYATR